MAVNQVSLSFYPPGWRQRLTPDPAAITDEGNPVQIADAVPVATAAARPLLPGVVAGWLAEHGFTPVAWGRAFERGRVRSIFGPAREIIIHVNVAADEVTDLYCRFTLPRPMPPPLGEWAGFVASLCGRFGLRLAPDGVGPCSEPEFLAAVRGNRNYREFAASLGWEVAQPPPGAAPAPAGT